MYPVKSCGYGGGLLWPAGTFFFIWGGGGVGVRPEFALNHLNFNPYSRFQMGNISVISTYFCLWITVIKHSCKTSKWVKN